MAKKESFAVAKDRLRVMKKLWQFHEQVVALPFPDFTSAKSIKKYAKAYKEILDEYFIDPDLFYDDLESSGLVKMLDYKSRDEIDKDIHWPFRDGAVCGLRFTRHHPYSHYDISGYTFVDEEDIQKVVKTANSIDYAYHLRTFLSATLEPIEKLLKSYPKPKTNGLQRVFGGKRYFKMKKESTDLYRNGR